MSHCMFYFCRLIKVRHIQEIKFPFKKIQTYFNIQNWVFRDQDQIFKNLMRPLERLDLNKLFLKAKADRSTEQKKRTSTSKEVWIHSEKDYLPPYRPPPPPPNDLILSS